jgi:hypothetical protein
MHLSISQLSELTGRDRRKIAKQLKDFQYTAGEWGAILYGISRGAAARLSLKDFIMDLKHDCDGNSEDPQLVLHLAPKLIC